MTDPQTLDAAAEAGSTGPLGCAAMGCAGFLVLVFGGAALLVLTVKLVQWIV